MTTTILDNLPANDDASSRRHRLWWRAVIICGLAPMAAGTAIFLAWMVTRAAVLMLAGYFAILGGSAMVDQLSPRGRLCLGRD
jgi:uncharacterized membrane protein HdeD (DUF308 family)